MTKAAPVLPVRSSPTPSTSDPSAIVILKESDLDCDLATAIRRVRAQETTAKSRILVIAPEPKDGGTVRSEPLPEGIPLSFAQAARQGEVAALQPFGRRMLSLLTCLERFFEESRWALDELEESVSEEPRARLLNQVRVLKEIQGWTQAVANDLRTEAKGASEGFRPIETAELWDEAIAQVQALLPEVRITLAPSEDGSLCWARAAELTEAFFLALLLTGNRVGAKGSVRIELERSEENFMTWVVRGNGEPSKVQAPDTIARLRRLIVEVHSGRLAADEFGTAGTGLRILLPHRV